MGKIGKFFIRQLKHLGYSLLIGLTISSIFAGLMLWTSGETFFRVSMYSMLIGFSLWKANESSTNAIENFFPWEKNPKKTLLIDFVGSALVSIITIFLVNLIFFRWLYEISIFENLQLFFIIGFMQLFIALLITGGFHLKKFFYAWVDATINEENLKREAQNLQYEALKSYVNPHFLFNSLSVLSSLVEKDVQKSQLFIRKLSDIYRYVLSQKNNELATLEEEVEFARSFADLHSIRHGNNLNVGIDVGNVSGFLVPLSLQILLENCFKHNVISEENPLNVRISIENDYVIVVNNLQKRRTVHLSGGVGLDTLKKRYEMISDNPVIICVTETDFIIKIPLIHKGYSGYKKSSDSNSAGTETMEYQFSLSQSK